MKQYYIKNVFQEKLFLLDAKTLEEAKSEIKEGFANSGKKTIVCVTFKKIKEKEYIIDTDYK